MYLIMKPPFELPLNFMTDNVYSIFGLVDENVYAHLLFNALVDAINNKPLNI